MNELLLHNPPGFPQDPKAGSPHEPKGTILRNYMEYERGPYHMECTSC